DVVLQRSPQGWQWYSSRTRQGRVWTAHSDIVEAGEKVESWINAREGASENPTNVRFSQGGEKQKNPTRSSFLSD
ncbi:hypothetical protein C210_27486, partial [Klebsiella pneumoniae subsp. pneumoniae KpMDU1]